MKKLLKNITVSNAKLIRTVISVYIIGVLGFLIPYTRDFFVDLTVLNLLFSLVVLFLAVWKDLNWRHISIFVSVYVLGYGIEVVGVNTGWPFGNYAYGEVLGVKFFETPLFIGINWLLLVLATNLIARQRIKNKWLVPLAAATMMLIFDIALEPFAIYTGMWTWEAIIVPFNNYVAWWLIAFVMHVLFVPLKFTRGYTVAAAVFLAQIVFFIIVNLKNYLI